MKIANNNPDARLLAADETETTAPAARPTVDDAAEQERRHARRLAQLGGNGVPFGLEPDDAQPGADDAAEAERRHAERLRSL